MVLSAPGRIAAAWLALALLVVAPRPARADGALSGLGFIDDLVLALTLVSVAEVLVPDVRWEWTDGFADGDATLTWPVPISLYTRHVGGGVGFGLEARGELHWRPGHGLRGVGAARLQIFAGPAARGGGRRIAVDRPYPWIYGEAGGVGGVDGAGALFGGGLMVGSHVIAGGIGYRIQAADGDRWRQSIGLDLHLALPVSEWL